MTRGGRSPASGRGAPSAGTGREASLGTLGDLLASRGVRGSATAPPPAARESSGARTGPDLALCGKIVLSRERKGHGGKMATVVAGLGLAGRDLESIAKALRRALGCGASVDGERVLVQGDQVARVRDWLAARGARWIVVGN
jgi:translation initiation factor 1